MILNVSYNNPATRKKIEAQVGKPFTLKERFQKKGIGSPRLTITQTSVQVSNLMELDNNRNVCNIELRPTGILVGFRALLESYVLVIPYYKLVLYKGKADEYAVYKDDYFIKINALPSNKTVHKFMQKIQGEKAAYDQNVKPPF